jgi:hypothetical protein
MTRPSRRRRAVAGRWLAWAGLAAGCQEYTIELELRDVGTPSAPADLSTPVRTDVVVQAPESKVDILWVIDNSGSMSEEQDAISSNLDAFLQFFVGSNVDFHMGVVTTDTLDAFQNGILREVAGYRFLTNDVPLALDVGRMMIKVGTAGSADEAGIDAAWRAITQPSREHIEGNKGFIREDAALHLIVISDEEDQSSSDPFEFARMLWSMKNSVDIPVTFSSIVGPLPNGCDSPTGNAAPGSRYIEVSRQVGGVIEPICVRDWTSVLEELGLLAAGLRTEFFLAEVPVPGSLEVWVTQRGARRDGLDLASIAEGEDLTAACDRAGKFDCFGYTFDERRNAIQLVDWLPPAGARVHVRYGLLSAAEAGLDSL